MTGVLLTRSSSDIGQELCRCLERRGIDTLGTYNIVNARAVHVMGCANKRRFVVSEPFGMFASVISSASQPVTLARAVTSGGYGGKVVSRVSSTGPPTVKW